MKAIPGQEPAIRSAWVDDRRQQLAEVAITARAATTDAAFSRVTGAILIGDGGLTFS